MGYKSTYWLLRILSQMAGDNGPLKGKQHLWVARSKTEHLHRTSLVLPYFCAWGGDPQKGWYLILLAEFYLV